jgi:hypothetical protein
MDCLSFINILDHICTTSFVFANLLEKFFQNLLQIVKVIRMWFQEAFLRFEIPPCFKCFSFDYIKAPPEWKFSLSFQEGFEIDTKWNYTNWNSFILNVKFWRCQFKTSSEIPIEKFTSHTNWKFILIKYQLKYLFLNFEMVVRSFCFALNNFSPFSINRQKRRTWEPYDNFPNTFLPIGTRNMSEGSYQLRVWRSNDKG